MFTFPTHRLAPMLLLAIAACADSPVASRPSINTLSLAIVSGDGQTGLANTELPDALVVEVLNDKGHPVRDQLVNFRVVSGGGSVFAGSSLTNRDGEAREWWTLGASGAQRVEVRAVDPTTGEKQVFAVFTATISSPPPPTEITPDFFEPNNFQGQGSARTLSPGSSTSYSANFHTVADVDWFRIDTRDPSSACFPGTDQDYRLAATLSNVPAGSTYRVALFEGSTLRAQGTVVGGAQGGFSFDYDGTCGIDDSATFDVRVDRLSGEPSATMYDLDVNYSRF